MRLRLALACCALAAFVASPADAATPIASFESAPCAGANVPVWRIAFRMYWRASDGRVIGRDPLASVLAETKLFVDAASANSHCSVRLHIDVFDEPGVWPTHTYAEIAPPDDDLRFKSAGDYDSTFYRYPGTTDDFVGLNGGEWSLFPVDVAAGPFYADSPWLYLMMHEWLHGVCFFFSDFADVQLPTPDVHGSFEHGYGKGGANEKRDYFADLMSGNVSENGKLTGIRPEQWIHYGTPRHPRNQDPALELTADVTGVQASATTDATITVTASLGERTLGTKRGTEMVALEVDLERGLPVVVCADAPATAQYLAAHTCKTVQFDPAADRLVRGIRWQRRNGAARVTFSVGAALVSHRARLRIAVGLPNRIAHSTRTITLRGTQTLSFACRSGGGWVNILVSLPDAVDAAGAHYRAGETSLYVVC